MKQTTLALFAFSLFLSNSIAYANYTKTKYPIVLVHGFSGFNNVGGVINYFHTIPYNLRRSGAKVYIPAVSSLFQFAS